MGLGDCDATIGSFCKNFYIGEEEEDEEEKKEEEVFFSFSQAAPVVQLTCGRPAVLVRCGAAPGAL